LAVTAFGAANCVASDSAKSISHHLTFGADIVFFGAILRMFFVARKDDSFSSVWPIVLAVMSVMLLLLDPIRHILLDHGGLFFKISDLAMYCEVDGQLVLSGTGRLSQIATVAGFVLLTLALSGYFNLPQRCFGSPKSCDARGG
jgi:hypothetical protein